jgi:nicotinamide mononucleotide adenylyltransferase
MDYTFPTHKLKPIGENLGKMPMVIVACGSFSPITYLHLRMFEMAKDHVVDNHQILGGYFSPVSDAYNKPGYVYRLFNKINLNCVNRPRFSKAQSRNG